MTIKRLDLVGINVEDLPAAKAFFLDLGLEVQGEGEGELAGAWLDRIVGLDDVKNSICVYGGTGRSGKY